jgi:acetoin utilization deacetylase AcuC-like enzyme
MSRKTAILKDDLFLEHDPGYNHPECPDRLKVIYDMLAKPEIASKFSFPSFGPASHEQLALNHTMAHIDRVAASAGKPFETLDPDTHTSPRSYEAACLAAGAVIKGMEMVAAGERLTMPPPWFARRATTPRPTAPAASACSTT